MTPAMTLEQITAHDVQPEMVIHKKKTLMQSIMQGTDRQTLNMMNLLLEEAAPLTSLNEIQSIASERATIARGKAMMLNIRVPADVSQGLRLKEADNHGQKLVEVTNIIANALQDETGLPILRSASNIEVSDKNTASLSEAYLISRNVLNVLRDRNEARIRTMHNLSSLPYNHALKQEEAGYLGAAPIISVGKENNNPDGMHMEMLAGAKNMINITIDSKTTSEKLEALIDMNKGADQGKLALVFAMGAKNVDAQLGPLLDVVAKHGDALITVCDPSSENKTLAEMKDEAISFTNQCIARKITPAGYDLAVNLSDISQQEMINDFIVPVAQNHVRAQTRAILRRG